MKVIYMEQTLQLIAKTKGVEQAKKIEKLGTIEYLEEIPYLVIEVNEEK